MSASSSSSQPQDQAVSHNQLPPLVVPENNSFIIVISRDLSEEELDLLREYGKVVIFNANIYNNIPIRSLEFDYFIIDIRRSEDRYYFQSIPLAIIEQYYLVSICYSIQRDDAYHEDMRADNVLSKLPPKQAFKVDFDRLMLQKKISRPHGGVSCIKSVFRLFSGQSF